MYLRDGDTGRGCGLWGLAGAAGEHSRNMPRGAQLTSPQLPGAPSLLGLSFDLMESRVLGPQSSLAPLAQNRGGPSDFFFLKKMGNSIIPQQPVSSGVGDLAAADGSVAAPWRSRCRREVVRFLRGGGGGGRHREQPSRVDQQTDLSSLAVTSEEKWGSG